MNSVQKLLQELREKWAQIPGKRRTWILAVLSTVVAGLPVQLVRPACLVIAVVSATYAVYEKGKWIRTTLWGVSFLTVAVTIFWVAHRMERSEPDIELYYQNRKLDGQTIVLKARCDLGTPIQSEACVDGNYPSNFLLCGMSVGNVGNATGEIQTAYLDISRRTNIAGQNTGWSRTDNGGKEFEENLNRTLVSPSQPPVMLQGFYGTPLPPGEVVAWIERIMRQTCG